MKKSLHLLLAGLVMTTFAASSQQRESAPTDHFTGLVNSIRSTKASPGPADYTDTYIHESYGKYSVQPDNNSSLLSLLPTHKYWLDYNYDDTFQLLETDKRVNTTYQHPQRFQPTTNLAGDIDSNATTYLEPSANKPLAFARHTSSNQLSASLLLKIVGEYEFNGLIARIELRGEKTLYLIMSGQPDYELEFMGNQVFANKHQPNYYVHFEVDEQGNVATISTIQSNGNFTFTRRASEPISTVKS
ncbi:hypothetical protein GCM10027592_53260 [Spirosoma flavus]